MHRWIVAAGAVVAAGLGAAALASADATSVSYGGITVNGSASETVAPGASAAQLQSDYLSELALAMSAAHAKAQFVAARLDYTLGSVLGFVENTDVPTQPCTVAPLVAATPGVAKGSAKPGSAKRGKPKSKGKAKKGKTTARKSSVVLVGGGCQVTASVTENYGYEPGPPTGPSGPTGPTGPSGPSGPTG